MRIRLDLCQAPVPFVSLAGHRPSQPGTPCPRHGVGVQMGIVGGSPSLLGLPSFLVGGTDALCRETEARRNAVRSGLCFQSWGPHPALPPR